MTYRVIHCGSGAMGKEALKGIIGHPELELVGQYVWSPEKVGADSGVLAGLEPCGITATDDWSTLYELGADCLCDFGRSMPGEHDRWLDHTLPMLERGTNVINFSAFEFAHPPTAPASERAAIEAACAAGNSSFFFTGIDPGWATTDLAIAALAAADRVDCVRVLELGWFGDYASQSLREVFGFGIEPGVTPGMLRDGKLKGLWAPTLYHIAEILGVEIDDWETFFEVDTLDHDVEAGIGTVKAGTAVVLHFELRAMSGGAPIAIVEHVDKIHRDGGRNWKSPHAPVDLVYRIEVEGSPSFSVEFAPRAGDMGACCAMPVVNAIPALCRAKPGLLGPLDLPRYWARNVRPTARRIGSHARESRFVITEDDLTGSETRALLRLHLEGMHADSPPGSVFALDLSGLQVPDVTVWSAWSGGKIAAIGALKMLRDGNAEVKSMRTHPNFIRHGAASEILETIISSARSKGASRLSLETGSGPAFEPALALYRKRGFVSGPPFADHEPSEFNQFLHMEL